MKIANAEQRGVRKVVFSKDDLWLDLTAALTEVDRSSQPVRFVQQLLDTGRFHVDYLGPIYDRAAETGRFGTGGDLHYRAPFSRPGQIIALARNYTAHAAESTLPIPHEPIFFSKANTSVVGSGEAVVLPPNLGRVEPEIELAVVIGKEASHVPAARAVEYIAGYTILNDVSAQELQAREIKESYPLFRCKSLKTFTPMGPCVVTVDEAGVEPQLDMALRVNDEVRVQTNSSGLTFGIPRLIEFISGYVLLMPGDIITTGCPKAAGAIHPGDEMTLEVEKIGILRNHVVAGTEPCPS